MRLHGSKDYLDMLLILKKFPGIRLTFNLVPSLLEQIEDYNNSATKDRLLELSYKPAQELSPQEKALVLEHFFSISKDKTISFHPRYYELFFRKLRKSEFNIQDYLDLQVWFNLVWIDPEFRNNTPELQALVNKARFFTEEEKRIVLEKQLAILKEIIPAYKNFIASGQIEATVSPFYHPILPLIYNSNIAKEANPKTALPQLKFQHPEDVLAQTEKAISFFKEKLGADPKGMWPSEESVCEHILPLLMGSGINWIVADEAILFKSLKKKKRSTELLYQPHLLKREEGSLNIVFRDKNLSDLISFVYCNLTAEEAVNDLMKHLENIHDAFKGQDILVTIAMDGENAWEYFRNDGHDFLGLLYQRLSDSKIIKTTTVSEYLNMHPAVSEIARLAAGSWIYGEFGKWIGNPYKCRAWECLAEARKKLEKIDESKFDAAQRDLIRKQMYILEGSDWFWWYGEDPGGAFDRMFRMHLSNFYTLIGEAVPEFLRKPLEPVELKTLSK